MKRWMTIFECVNEHNEMSMDHDERRMRMGMIYTREYAR